MKKLIYTIIVLSVLSGCKSYKEEFDLVSRERDSLIIAGDVKDFSINSFLASFNEIATNLDTIVSKKESIEQNASMDTESKTDKRDRINEDIRIINEMLEKNKQIVADLQKKVRSQGGQISGLKQMIENMTKQMAQKDTELVALKFQLDELKLNIENLNVTVDTLTAQNQIKEVDLKSKIEKLNTAYYIAGTSKDLEAKKVANKEGGFLGIGKNQLLKQDFNSDAFTKVDITQTHSIDLNCKEVKVLTNHPTSSYSIDRDKNKVKALIIKDYESFWGASKYLVIVKN